jgi:hypothetical protein
MKKLYFIIGSEHGPAYDGFWVPGTSGEKHLSGHCIIRVRAGRYYWLKGFPENTLPSHCHGQTQPGGGLARAIVLRKDSEGVWYDEEKKYVKGDLEDIFAFAEINGKLHIVHLDNVYPVRYSRATMVEINMYRSWGS